MSRKLGGPDIRVIITDILAAAFPFTDAETYAKIEGAPYPKYGSRVLNDLTIKLAIAVTRLPEPPLVDQAIDLIGRLTESERRKVERVVAARSKAFRS